MQVGKHLIIYFLQISVSSATWILFNVPKLLGRHAVLSWCVCYMWLHIRGAETR